MREAVSGRMLFNFGFMSECIKQGSTQSWQPMLWTGFTLQYCCREGVLTWHKYHGAETEEDDLFEIFRVLKFC